MAKLSDELSSSFSSIRSPIVLSPSSSPLKKSDLQNSVNIRNNLPPNCNSTPRSNKKHFTSIDLSPVTSRSCSKSDIDSSLLCENNENSDNLHTRRGRPKLDAIKCLINNASDSNSAIRCHTCNRVFPREKSLQAHIRTHTGEKPYICNYSGCSKRFTQSGQLRTHQRLHTGEKPFACKYPGCDNRFTHANRRCPLHPQHGVRRDRITLTHNPNKSTKENQSNLTSINLHENTQNDYNKSNSEEEEEDVRTEVVNWLTTQCDIIKNNLYSTGIKRKHSSKSIRFIKKRKLSLDDCFENEEDDENLDGTDTRVKLIWKKKRAALELHAKETSLKSLSESDNQSEILDQKTDTINIIINDKSFLNEQLLNESINSEVYDDDRLEGALALIQLSKSKPYLDCNYEIDLNLSEVHPENCCDYFASSQGDLNYSGYSFNEEFY